MNLYMKQKVFSFGDKFHIYDEEGREKYYVEGAVFSFGKKLTVYDAVGGEEVAYIEQKIFTFLPKFHVTLKNRAKLEVVKSFTFFRPKYTVEPLGWTVRGDFFDHDYDVMEGDALIARVAKRWLSWGDAYEISISPNADEATVLSVILVIDACLEQQKD